MYILIYRRNRKDTKSRRYRHNIAGRIDMRTLTRRFVLLAAMTAPLGAYGVNAQSIPQDNPLGWPAGTIKLIVPYPPGGSTDVIARLVQPCLQQRLGTTVIIENRAGASGSVGTATVAKSPPDGGTWLLVFDNHAANPFVLPDLPYDTEKDLDPVLFIGTAPYVVSTQEQKPFKSLADVIAAAKAKPGAVSYASVGSGSVGHLAMALLSKQAGIRLVHVPYRGGGPAMNDAIAGHVDLLIGSAALVTPQVKAGRLRALMQTGKARIPALPEIATAIESGFAGFESYAWWGVFTAAGTPKATIERFSTALAETLREPAINTQISENLQITMRLGGPEEERTFLSEQMKLWGPVVREHGIKGE
jgi:tripartite-type tricarboxylate transporter receptor subunit TctC